MFKNSKQNKIFLLLLSTASMIIWGVIVYQLLWGINYSPEEEFIETFTTLKPRLSDLDSTYHSIFTTNAARLRNPFRPLLEQKRKAAASNTKIKSLPKAPPEPKPPDIRYIGFLGDNNGSLAILKLADGSTQICSEGDSLGGVMLSKIEKHQILAFFNGKSFPVPLKP